MATNSITNIKSVILCKDTQISMFKEHQPYIYRCLELAKKGIFEALPNPSVGAVIVYNGLIIGEGFTSKYGGPHAEVNAINSVKNLELLSKSILYVSLEPCSHFGKTPPCADLIIKMNIPKVVIGITDPFSKVCGQGIAKLKHAGIEVIVGVLEDECKELNKRFLTLHQKQRPYIILKWAQTLDGFIAPINSENHKVFWISNSYSQQLVHKWRSEEVAFLVGTKTVESDNPSLTTRSWFGKNPLRIFIDRTGNLAQSYSLKNQEAKTLCFTENPNAINNEHLIHIQIDFSENIIPQICETLFQMQIASIVIEGGLKTLQSFIDLDYWDEARIFTSQNTLIKGIKSPILNKYNKVFVQKLDSDILTIKYH